MDKLTALRTLMKERNIDAYIIPSGDDHNSEYVADYWKSRTWISGFTGSAGLAVVTHNEAYLWTDGRYFIQAENELDKFSLQKIGALGVPTYQEYLKEKLPTNGTVGFDGRALSVADFGALKTLLGDITYSYNEDLVGLIWDNRPPLPTAPAFVHLPEFAGFSVAEKLELVRKKMVETKVETYLVTALDDVAWLLNIRGSDTGSTPLVYAYVVITSNDAWLFINPEKIAGIEGHLEDFIVMPYDAIPEVLSAVPAADSRIYYNASKTSMLLTDSIPDGVAVATETQDIIAYMKSEKTDHELANMRNAYVKEGVVIVRLLKWLDDSLAAGKTLTEADVVDKLASLRTEQKHAIGESFAAIAAYGANAALPHYHHSGRGCEIKPEGLFLLDCGGQYLDGTTDTTRTIAVGEITPEIKRNFTLVLKGHIALTLAVFPKGTTGQPLDIISRMPLMQECLDFNHGTGHGIGYCLSVHEGPQSISKASTVALVPGMVLSNEPGFYKEGEYGIRIENAIAVKEIGKNEFGEFLGFETLTYCPYDLSAVDAEILTQIEKDFINKYHRRVVDTLCPLLDEDETVWLKNRTRAI